MENRAIYKRVKINWWVILLFVGISGGIGIQMIFAYIHQWGNNPIPNMTALILLETFLVVPIIVALFIFGRFKLIIDDNFVIIRTGLWTQCKVSYASINKISVRQYTKFATGSIKFSGKNRIISFDFINQFVKIQLKNGKNYWIAIKNAEKIKEEIEKRMIK